MKKILSILLTAILLFSAIPLTASADTYNGTCGENLTWEFNEDTGALTIEGTGDMTDYSNSSNAPWYKNYRNKIKQIEISSGVTSIGNFAFYGCRYITQIVTPNTITDIGEYAFYYCTSLKQIFISNNIENINIKAFNNCNELETINVSSENNIYCSKNNCLIKKDTKTLILGTNNSIIPTDNSVTCIGGYAFYGRTSLEKLLIPNNITEIANDAFYQCSGLKEIVIPNSVVSIGIRAFKYCTGLKKLFIPENLKSIGNFAFEECINLEKIDVDLKNTVYYSETNCLIEKATKTLILGCKNSIIPNNENVAIIGTSAFSDCDDLTEIAIPNNIKTIRTYAFSSCSGLSRIVIPTSVTNINSYAFYFCNNLKTITNYSSLEIVKGSTDNGEIAQYADTVNNIKAPVFSGKTDTSVTLVANESYEYSKDGSTWQDSNTFVGLSPMTEYSFYQRLKGETNKYAYSFPLKVTTDKSTFEKPSAPTLSAKNNTTVTLNPNSGYEYRVDNGEWQADNTFKGLKSNTEYTFYQRVAETATSYASPTSDGLKVKTDNHKFGDWYVSKKADCTNDGTETRKCETCGATENRSIKALGHNFLKPTITKKATCTENGIESGKCTRCNKNATDSIPAKGHSFGEWAEIKAPSCTEKGIEERKCSACDTKETRDIKALGHSFIKPIIVKEATISSTGLMEGKCKLCGEKTSEIIPCTAKDEINGIIFEAEENVFADGTEISVNKIEKTDSIFKTAETALNEIGTKYEVYNISAIFEETAVQPNGKVNATFNIPADFSKNIAVYLIEADGTITKVESIVSEDGKTVTAELSKFGTYAIVELKETKTETNNNTDITTDTDNEKNEFNIWWVIIAVAVVLIIIGIIIILIKKKQKE